MEVELNQEHEGQKTRSRWIERCRYRAGEIVTHTWAVLLCCGRPLPPPQPSPLCQHPSSYPTSTSPPLPFHFQCSPPEPDRQTLQDTGIITLFPCRLELLPELTLAVWSAPPPQGPQWPKWQPQMLMIPCLETMPSSSTPSCRGSPTSLWSQRQVSPTVKEAFRLNSALVVYHWKLKKSQKPHTRDMTVQN